MESQELFDLTDIEWCFLIIGEEEIVANELRELLDEKFSKSNILVAPDGPSGFRQAMSEQPDLIILNIDAPKTNGKLVCEKLKLDEHVAHTPIIMLAQSDNPEETTAAYSAGAEAVIYKPLDKDIFMHTVKILLDWRRTHQQQNITNNQLMEAFRVLANIAGLSEKLLTVNEFNKGWQEFESSLTLIGFEGQLLFASEQSDRDAITIALEKGVITERHTDGEGSLFVLPFKAMKRYGLFKIASETKVNRYYYIDVFKMYRDLLISFMEKCILWDRQKFMLDTVQGTVRKICDSAGQYGISDKLMLTSGDVEKLGNTILDKIDLVYQKQGKNEDISSELMDIQMASQEFDRLGQKIKYILQLFENVVKIAEGREAEVVRDRSLFSTSSTDQSEIDNLIGGL